MNQSQQKNLSHAIAKVDLILKYVIQIENEMRINDSFDKKNPLTQNVYKRNVWNASTCSCEFNKICKIDI